jgi:hypothetical protein
MTCPDCGLVYLYQAKCPDCTVRVALRLKSRPREKRDTHLKRVRLTEEERREMEREYVEEMSKDAEREGTGSW